jgi:hypothetical protein
LYCVTIHVYYCDVTIVYLLYHVTIHAYCIVLQSMCITVMLQLYIYCIMLYVSCHVISSQPISPHSHHIAYHPRIPILSLQPFAYHPRIPHIVPPTGCIGTCIRQTPLARVPPHGISDEWFVDATCVLMCWSVSDVEEVYRHVGLFCSVHMPSVAVHRRSGMR